MFNLKVINFNLNNKIFIRLKNRILLLYIISYFNIFFYLIKEDNFFK